jgi:hypothetical protein
MKTYDTLKECLADGFSHYDDVDGGYLMARWTDRSGPPYEVRGIEFARCPVEPPPPRIAKAIKSLEEVQRMIGGAGREL